MKRILNKLLRTLSEDRPVMDVSIISVAISIIFIATNISFFINDHNNLKGDFSLLTGNTMKFTNYWLKDGIVNDKFAMLEKPLSIESSTFDERTPYISYPNGVVLIPYGIAKILGLKQVDPQFIRNINVMFYGLDAILIGILFYLSLTYLLKIRTKTGRIILPVLLSWLWIELPINGYYLQFVFFSDQLVLFFIYLLLVLELLKNYSGITHTKHKIIINILLFLTILYGMLVDYYFWIQLFILCVINFTNSLLQKESVSCSVKKLSVYVIPAFLGVGLYLFQLIQVNDWTNILFDIAKYRMGLGEELVGHSVLRTITDRIVVAYGWSGFIVFIAFTVAFITILYVNIFKSSILHNKGLHKNILLLFCLIILPAYIQLGVLNNHCKGHEFAILKLGFLFVSGFLLVTYAVFVFFKQPLNSALEMTTLKQHHGYEKRLLNRYCCLTVVLLIAYLLTSGFSLRRYQYAALRYYYRNPTFEMAEIVKRQATYENVFFSYTDSITDLRSTIIQLQPLLHLSNKMVYRIDDFSDIQQLFPELPTSAVILLVINKNAEKSNDVEEKERYVVEAGQPVEESDNYVIYKLPPH